MTEDRPPNDDEVSRWVKAWRVPDAPARLDARVFASYRDGLWRGRLSWRFLWTSSVRVPLPVALGVTLLCVFSLLAALRPGGRVRARPGTAVSAPSSPEPVPEKDLTGFEPASEMKVTILYPGDAR